jgi:hypothetical protein
VKKFLLSLIVIFTVSLITGCGGVVDISRMQFEAPIQGLGKVAVVVHDQRPFVVNENKQPNFIGLRRNGYGMPMDVVTKSGETLADDVSAIITSSLRGSGFQAKSFEVTHEETVESSINKIVKEQYDRVVVFTISQFRSDTWFEVELVWALSLDVYDNAGSMLSHYSLEGQDEALYKNSMGVSKAQGQKAIVGKLALILHEMLVEPKTQLAMTFEPKNAVNILSQDDIAHLDIEEDILALKEQIEAGDPIKMKFRAQNLYRTGVTDQDVLDQLAELIWEERESNNRYVVNCLGYLCKTFMKAKDPRYTLFFKELEKNAKSRKLRKYAIRTSGRLDVGVVEQFKIDN